MSLQFQYAPRKAVGINDPGLLDRRVALQSPASSTDIYGGPVMTWALVDTVWASKAPLNGSRMELSSQTRYEVFVQFRIRHRTDVQAGWQLVHGTEVYEVTFTEELGRRHLLNLTCRLVENLGAIAATVISGDPITDESGGEITDESGESITDQPAVAVDQSGNPITDQYGNPISSP